MTPTVSTSTPERRGITTGTRSRWMIGLRFRGANGGFVLHYYVVDARQDRSGALRYALGQAMRCSEIEQRDDAPIDTGWSEIRFLTLDPIRRLRFDTGPA
ncbi:hypothetical protein [Embleya scabrispora]|uniref:hypothetical protein n=1 Tax=Embleya scabrispora TaxID=159449 RepID=UPI000366DE2D|nr:hypothetical protein [Embleya scabrispora]MYS81793.1 hypothetical protein [Streptomyces sp. SID5474]